MRTNLPVTDVEIELSDQFAIVSTTDLQGNITYANPYFVEISGYAVHELIGAPQNILRHPDMPVEAFADMWATLKSGMPWTGMVKNRTKKGDFYWVLANATPIYERGQAVGYMSVRTKPTRVQVAQTSALYQRIREGKARGLQLKNGSVAPTGLARLAHLTIGQKLAGVQLLLFVCLIELVWQALWPSGAGSELAWVWHVSVAALGVSSLAWLAFILQRQVLQPLTRVTQVSRIMAGGDLTINPEPAGQDELGQLQNAVRQMGVNLRSIIGDVRGNFASIHQATQEIASGNMDLSNRTESQASSLEETAASMEELTGAVHQSAQNATLANTLASDAAAAADAGGSIVTQAVTTMTDINQASHKIVDIIGLIDGIAFQTNILALNAAVEAARAGEQGRGFAVVASEVRSLAGRSASAAKEIKVLIETSLGKVASGLTLTAEVGGAMQKVIDANGKMTNMMTEISSAADQQSLGIAQVNQAVSHMDTVTQQNAALVEQAAAATANLATQMDQLTNALAIFKLPRG
jgi:aerotaxis receptor